jgi:hypothetical protein
VLNFEDSNLKEVEEINAQGLHDRADQLLYVENVTPSKSDQSCGLPVQYCGLPVLSRPLNPQGEGKPESEGAPQQGSRHPDDADQGNATAQRRDARPRVPRTAEKPLAAQYFNAAADRGEAAARCDCAVLRDAGEGCRRPTARSPIFQTGVRSGQRTGFGHFRASVRPGRGEAPGLRRRKRSARIN